MGDVEVADAEYARGRVEEVVDAVQCRVEGGNLG